MLRGCFCGKYGNSLCFGKKNGVRGADAVHYGRGRVTQNYSDNSIESNSVDYLNIVNYINNIK